MSDQNLFVKLVKKSVGLPTGEASCCGGVSQASQETTDQCCWEQTADTSSCCDSQESVDFQTNEASSCKCAASQAAQEETAKQGAEKKQPAAASSCCG